MDVAAAMVQEGVLAPDAVARALAGARDGDVASAALRLGLCDEPSLLRALARAYECPGVDLSRSVIPTKNLEVMAPDFCRERKVIPVTVGRTEIVLAMADPDDAALADEVRFVTGRKVMRYAAVGVSIERAIGATVRAREAGQVAWRGPGAPVLPDPGGGWAAVVKPGERALSAVELPDVEEKMELIAASDFIGPFHSGPPQAPATAAAPGRPPPASAGESATQTLRLSGAAVGKVVLVVDDDPDVLRLAATMLAKLGCVVLEASNGRQGLEIAREARPDLVLLDAMMPGLHGFEVCRAIKSDKDLKGMPVILCSAVYRGSAADDAQITFGADAFLAKPFRVDDLTRVVKVALLGASAETSDERAARAQAEKAWRGAAEALKQGKDQEALSLAQAACTHLPRSAEAHYYLGHALSRLGRFYEAVVAYERSAELRPDVDAAYKCLAQTYERLGFQKAAREAWAHAIESCKDPARKKAMQARLMSLLGG